MILKYLFIKHLKGGGRRDWSGNCGFLWRESEGETKERPKPTGHHKDKIKMPMAFIAGDIKNVFILEKPFSSTVWVTDICSFLLQRIKLLKVLLLTLSGLGGKALRTKKELRTKSCWWWYLEILTGEGFIGIKTLYEDRTSQFCLFVRFHILWALLGERNPLHSSNLSSGHFKFSRKGWGELGEFCLQGWHPPGGENAMDWGLVHEGVVVVSGMFWDFPEGWPGMRPKPLDYV